MPGRGPLSVPVWCFYQTGGEIVVVTRSAVTWELYDLSKDWTKRLMQESQRNNKTSE